MAFFYSLQLFFYCCYEVLDEERLALHLIVLVVSELWQDAAEVVHELAAVELAYEDLIELLEDLSCVLWKRHDVIEMSKAHIDSLSTYFLDC